MSFYRADRQFSSFRWKPLLTALVALLMITTGGYSQTIYGSITGTVTDPSGAVIPKATITATSQAIGVAMSAISSDAGMYTVPQLPEGTYQLRAEAAGFKEYIVQDLKIGTREIRRIDVKLQVGPTTTSVEVSGGEIPQIETETARVSDLKTADTLKTLPLNARWLWDFFNQVPGMQSSGDGYRFMGSTGNLSNFSIDGTTMNDGKGWQIGPLLNYMESYQEVKVDVANNSAEFVGVGNVEVVTKAGSNRLHGAIFDQYWPPSLKEPGHFQDSVDPTRFHIFGGGVGGPVVIPKLYNGSNKTFFYGSFERSAGSKSSSYANTGVPLQSWRDGDFSGAGTVIYDPTNNSPFGGNKIPTSRLNSVSQKIQERFYPLPNYGDPSVFSSTNFREVVTHGWNAPWNGTGRIDHHFSDKNFLFGRFTVTGGPSAGFNGLSTLGYNNGYRGTRSATVSFTHVFSATVINEARWGMNYNDNTWAGATRGQDILKSLNLVGLAPNLPDSPGLLDIFWNGIALQQLYQWNGGGPPGWRNINHQFQDYVNLFHGRHNIKVGIDLTRALYDNQAVPDALFGQAWFSSRFTSGGIDGQGHPYADFLLGIPTTSARAFPALRETESRWQYAGFITDQFKVNPSLTVTVGLRYQLHTPWTEHHGRLAVFDIGSGSIVVPDKGMSEISPLFPTSYAKVASASSLHLPQTMVRADKNDFAPRIGAAWTPFGTTTVFRAGFGVFYDIVPFEFLSSGSPFQLSEFPYTNPATNPDVIFPRVFPDTSGTKYDSINLPSAVNPNLRSPMTMTYSFAVEHDFWKNMVGLTYNGTAQRYGTFSYNYNSPLPSDQPYISKARPFQQYPDIYYRTNGAGHQYNGLMTTVKRNVGGAHLSFAWTWQRDRYDLERWDAPENPFDRHREIAVNSAFPTHRVVSNGYYELPFGKGKRIGGSVGRLGNLVLGGWIVSTTFGYDSGVFLTPGLWTPDPTGTAFTTSDTAPWVYIRPDQTADANLPGGQRTIDHWFNTDAFSAPAKGRYGTAAKNVIKGPNGLMWNGGLTKEFRLSERGTKVIFQTSFKNMLNRQNWSNPNTDISNAGGVGRITWDGGHTDSASPRAGTLVLRVEW